MNFQKSPLKFTVCMETLRCLKVIGGRPRSKKWLGFILKQILCTFICFWQNFKILPHFPKIDPKVEPGRASFTVILVLVDSKTWKIGALEHCYGSKTNKYAQVKTSTGDIWRFTSILQVQLVKQCHSCKANHASESCCSGTKNCVCQGDLKLT